MQSESPYFAFGFFVLKFVWRVVLWFFCVEIRVEGGAQRGWCSAGLSAFV